MSLVNCFVCLSSTFLTSPWVIPCAAVAEPANVAETIRLATGSYNTNMVVPIPHHRHSVLCVQHTINTGQVKTRRGKQSSSIFPAPVPLCSNPSPLLAQ